MYIPPQSSPTVPNTFRPQLSQLTSIPNLIMGGDFNAKSSAWFVDNPDTDRGLDIQTQFDSLTIMNNTHNHTHIPYQALYTPSSPDITFCSPCLTPTTSWRVVGALGSDHLPIIITTKTRCTPAGHRHTYTNYKRANWEAFNEETEQHFETLNSTPITNINNAVHAFNTIIQNADKRYIPRGNRKSHNPNFTPEIQGLIRQRDTLKHDTPTPIPQNIADQIQTLNTVIANKIHEQKTQNWQNFINTLDHKTNTSKLYKTLNSITLSNTNTTRSHAAIITTTDNLPSNRQQANALIRHFAQTSHLTSHPDDRRTIRRKKDFPTDSDYTPFIDTLTTSGLTMYLTPSQPLDRSRDMM
ncbi:uncharacterized protein LOC143022179 [Oratosquilla oratoria]|uniref:uncharacterized protein LOC143022179 n=1 Tax=Oratosquilla oratoria TaxID=337810 RepID=UPI003F75A34D